ncbi:MAG: acyl carrier protein [Flavobacterium sp.]|uniref:acyl carrier protein n=1 Tax=Flavobacterium sp. TaxID=239 RepID=UPI001225ADE3|nr:acyl carrier protein [Flavobacterium sp.]RZJ65403.1 MAG: acyl carrier protein [Flavobacterium sp.]
MENNAIAQKLAPVFKSVFNNENLEVTESLSANDVDNWDSLSHMILISEVEKTFGITFKLRELNKMKNVGDMIDVIASKL